jgi:hypothetical protein
MEVFDYGIEIEAPEFLRIVEALAQGVRQGRVLVQNVQI